MRWPPVPVRFASCAVINVVSPIETIKIVGRVGEQPQKPAATAVSDERTGETVKSSAIQATTLRNARDDAGTVQLFRRSAGSQNGLRPESRSSDSPWVSTSLVVATATDSRRWMPAAVRVP